MMDHKFFDGIDWDAIPNETPPVKLELNEHQKVLMKYLPKYRKNTRTTPSYNTSQSVSRGQPSFDNTTN